MNEEKERRLAYEEAKALESAVNANMKSGMVSAERSWFAYFLLMHQYEALGYISEGRRVLKKIDAKRFKPLESDILEVARVAEIRAQRSPYGNPFDPFIGVETN